MVSLSIKFRIKCTDIQIAYCIHVDTIPPTFRYMHIAHNYLLLTVNLKLQPAFIVVIISNTYYIFAILLAIK